MCLQLWWDVLSLFGQYGWIYDMSLPLWLDCMLYVCQYSLVFELMLLTCMWC